MNQMSYQGRCVQDMWKKGHYQSSDKAKVVIFAITSNPILSTITASVGLIRAYASFKNVLANLTVVFQNQQAQQNFHWPSKVLIRSMILHIDLVLTRILN